MTKSEKKKPEAWQNVNWICEVRYTKDIDKAQQSYDDYDVRNKKQRKGVKQEWMTLP